MGAKQGKIANDKSASRNVQNVTLMPIQTQHTPQQSTLSLPSSKKESTMNIITILLFICLVIAIIIIVRQRNLSQYNLPSPYLVPIPTRPA